MKRITIMIEPEPPDSTVKSISMMTDEGNPEPDRWRIEDLFNAALASLWPDRHERAYLYCISKEGSE